MLPGHMMLGKMLDEQMSLDHLSTALYNFDKVNRIIVILVFWEYKLYDLSVPWNIQRFVHNDIQIFGPKIFEYSSQKYSNIRAKIIRIFVFGPL